MELEPASFAQVRKGRNGRNVLVEDDVLCIVKQVREVDSSLRVRWNERGEYFVVYQRRSNGREKLVLTANQLDQRIVNRVRQIVHPDYDLVADMEKMDREADKAKQHRFAEKIGETGEHLYHALRKDRQAKSSIYVP